MKVTIKSRNIKTKKYPFEGPFERTDVYVDDVYIGGGTYGGEPEDNMRCRDYDWVEMLLDTLATKLGAEVKVESTDEEANSVYEIGP